MVRNKLLLFIAVVVGLGLLAWKEYLLPSRSQLPIDVPVSKYNFGDVPAGRLLEYSFVLKNTSQDNEVKKGTGIFSVSIGVDP